MRNAEQKLASAAASRRYYAKNAEAVKAKKREYFKQQYAEARSKVMDLLGEQCHECGIADPRVLQIDHVNGGGRLHRKKSSLSVYKDILANPASYQVLCANCHAIKTVAA